MDAAVAGVIGGLIGAKLLWTLEFSGETPVTELLFSRAGLSWFGGLIEVLGQGCGCSAVAEFLSFAR